MLPSDYSGGELLVRHKGQEVRLDLRRDEPSEAAFAAFYADCRHEVLPIASGYRLALIYNLVRGTLPEPPDYDAEQAQVTGLLHDWRHPDGSHPAMGALPFYGDEVCPPDALDDAEDVEPDFAEATGRENRVRSRFEASRPSSLCISTTAAMLALCTGSIQQW